MEGVRTVNTSQPEEDSGLFTDSYSAALWTLVDPLQLDFLGISETLLIRLALFEY